MSVGHEARKPWLPPRWFIRLAWSAHRGVYRIGGRRAGLWRPRGNGWGALRLTPSPPGGSTYRHPRRRLRDSGVSGGSGRSR
jgi:hypothetical protein